jgi:ABC-type dipeptide transport system, periplasmic component
MTIPSGVSPSAPRAATAGPHSSRYPAAGTRPARAAEGQLVYASHISLAPAWFDPAETSGIVTPFMLLYALHDGLVKPMPGNPAEPCLAESYTASADGLAHSFVLRAGATFHNGAPVTAEDVKFSFERYRGNAARFIKEKVAAVETPDPRRVVFRCTSLGPISSSTIPALPARAGSCRKQYVESVGEDGFKKAAHRRGAVQVRLFHPRRRTGDGGVRRLLAQGAHREEAGLEGDSRRDHATRGAEARRGRSRLLDPRRAGRGIAAHAWAGAEAGGDQLAVLDLFRRSVGPEIALARRAGAQGRDPRAGSRRHQPGAHARLFTAHRQHRAEGLRLLLAAAEDSARSGRPRDGCWRKRASAAASMPGSITATPPTPTSPRRR